MTNGASVTTDQTQPLNRTEDDHDLEGLFSPLKRILIATDFSKPAEGAFRYAAQLAIHRGAQLHVVHAIEWLESWWSPLKSSPDFLAQLHEHGREKFETSLSQFGGKPLDAGFETETGNAPEVVLNILRKRPFDLVVLGTRGRHGAKKLLLGSTTERVVERSTVPVLTLSPEAKRLTKSPRRILLPTDLSLEFEDLLIAAARVAGATTLSDLELVIVHAIDLPRRYESLVENWDRFAHGSVETLREHLNEVAEELCNEGATVETIVETGPAAELIRKVAESRSVDLIALHTRGAVAKRLPYFGGTARQVLKEAPCPVLTLAP